MSWHREKEYAEFEVECMSETAQAILVETDGGEKYWVPKSLIHDDSAVQGQGDAGTLIVEEWFAMKAGME